MRNKFSPILLAACYALTPLAAQVPTFSNPLEMPVDLSATFAEVRSNHFHAGIDMRTGGTEGHAVHAAADGYVSAIRISSWGGGKMLYITHADGYSTVYMHLSSYEGAIAKAVLAEQYQKQQYAVYKEFAPDELPVKRGQVVARSGNTGGSGGPHLHFEVRRDGRTLNPLLYGLNYHDGVKPTIRGIRLYPVGGKPIDVGQNGSISLSQPFYIGVYATDAAEGSTPRNGIDRIEISIDGTPFFIYTTEGFPLDNSRMVNAIIDYPHYSQTKQYYIITRVLPGADGEWIPLLQNDGIARLKPGKHRICIKAFDISENYAERNLIVNVETPALSQSNPSVSMPQGLPVVFYKTLQKSDKDFRINMPAFTLYADDRLSITTSPSLNTLSPTIEIRPLINDLPPDKWYTLSLRILQRDEHAVIVRQENGRTIAYRTTMRDGYYTAEVRDFGHFAVVADTLPPSATATNLKGNTLKVKISDVLSGIDTYHCYLDGEWILAEFDGKGSTLVIDARGKLQPGQHTLRVELTDLAGNCLTRTFNLTR